MGLQMLNVCNDEELIDDAFRFLAPQNSVSKV